MNIANILTLLRTMSPIFFCCIIFFEFELHLEKNIIFIIFIIFSLTDFFDGLLARKLNQVSTFGKIFDPISDKVLTSSTLIYILTFEINILIPAMLIIAREFIVSGNREYMLKTESKEISVFYLSKIKTTFQFLSISLYLAQDLLLQYYNISIIALIFLWVATILTIYTGIKYSYITFFSNRKRK